MNKKKIVIIILAALLAFAAYIGGVELYNRRSLNYEPFKEYVPNTSDVIDFGNETDETATKMLNGNYEALTDSDNEYLTELTWDATKFYCLKGGEQKAIYNSDEQMPSNAEVSRQELMSLIEYEGSEVGLFHTKYKCSHSISADIGDIEDVMEIFYDPLVPFLHTVDTSSVESDNPMYTINKASDHYVLAKLNDPQNAVSTYQLTLFRVLDNTTFEIFSISEENTPDVIESILSFLDDTK